MKIFTARKTSGIYLILIVLVLTGIFLQAQESHIVDVMGELIPLEFDTERGVIVIEGEFLRKLPAANIFQLLSTAANMHFVSRGIFQADPQIMGFNQEQMTVMVDNVPMNNAQTGHHNFVLPVSIQDIERIEILRGEGSAVHGFSGNAGVVNIITAPGNNLSVSSASFNTHSFYIGHRSSNFWASSELMSTDGHLEGIDGSRFILRSGMRISGKSDVLDIWAGGVLQKFGAFNFYAPYPSYEKLGRLMGALRLHHRFTQDLNLVMTLSSQFSADDFTLLRTLPDIYNNLHHTYQHTFRLGLKKKYSRMNWFFGISGHLDSIDSTGIRSGLKADALGRHRRNIFSAFGEFSLDHGSFFASSGIRISEGSYGNISANLLLGWRPDSRLKISGSLFRTFRIPTYTELYYSDPSHRTSSDLRPEVTWCGSLSIGSDSGSVAWSCRLFYSRSSRLIDWLWSDAEQLWISGNISKGSYRGLDLSAAYEKKHFTARLLYTYQKASFGDSYADNIMKYRYYFPDHSLSLTVSINFSRISISSSIKAERELRSGRLNPYLNSKVMLPLGKASFYVEFMNIFDTQVEKIAGLPEAPRTFGAGLLLRY